MTELPDEGTGGRDPVGALFGARLREVPFAVLDLELTGLSPQGDRICELAIVSGRAGKVHREYQTLVRTSARMSEGARRCHGITERMLERAPSFREIAADVLRELDGCVLVAHNVEFDLGFLHRAFEAARVPFAPPVTLDTLLVARRLFAFPKNGLPDVARELGIALPGLHRALTDARSCWAVLQAMLERFDPSGTVTVRDLDELVGALAPNSPLRARQQQVLREAFERGRTVVLDYQSTSDPVGGLVRREVGIWFLHLPKLQGWCHLRQSERVFRLDRIRHVEPGDREVVVPPDAVRRI